VVDERLGLVVIGRESTIDHLGGVVGSALELGAPEQALAGDVVFELEQEDDVERPLDLLQHVVERLGLGDVARESIEHEAAARVHELLADEGGGDLVRDEVPCVEQRLDLAAERRVRRDRSPEEIAGCDVRDAVLGSDPLRLRPFPRPLRPEDQDVQRKNPS
jgi:hypothetical protein